MISWPHVDSLFLQLSMQFSDSIGNEYMYFNTKQLTIKIVNYYSTFPVFLKK